MSGPVGPLGFPGWGPDESRLDLRLTGPPPPRGRGPAPRGRPRLVTKFCDTFSCGVVVEAFFVRHASTLCVRLSPIVVIKNVAPSDYNNNNNNYIKPIPFEFRVYKKSRKARIKYSTIKPRITIHISYIEFHEIHIHI